MTGTSAQGIVQISQTGQLVAAWVPTGVSGSDETPLTASLLGPHNSAAPSPLELLQHMHYPLL